MRRTVIIALVTTGVVSSVANQAIAQPNLHELAQVKSNEIIVTKSSRHIDFTAIQDYEKYIISISGDGGFSHTIESDYPTLDLTDLELPYDGSYNYEIKAIQNVAEIKDTMNNGRSADARGKISIVDVKSGKFTTEFNEVVVSQDISEPIKGILPIKKAFNDKGSK